jgi:hypothetical protein
MRIWTLHPRYLDHRGLVAVWREALLAQAVLRGRTRGYTRHPQLQRFRQSGSPLGCIAHYLRTIHDEATRRGYNFDAHRIGRSRPVGLIRTTHGQLLFEWSHLRRKLTVRDPEWLSRLSQVPDLDAHPVFEIISGDVEDWERGAPKNKQRPRRKTTKKLN